MRDPDNFLTSRLEKRKKSPEGQVLKCVQVKEINAVGDPVLNEHALGVAPGQLCRRTTQLVVNQDDRVLVTQIRNCQLAQGTFVIRESMRNSALGGYLPSFFCRNQPVYLQVYEFGFP